MTSRYARCPGCGDNGDVNHVVACVAMMRKRYGEEYDRGVRDGWKAAMSSAIAVLEKQIARRGLVTVQALRDMLEAAS